MFWPRPGKSANEGGELWLDDLMGNGDREEWAARYLDDLMYTCGQE